MNIPDISNTAVGSHALQQNITGNNNTAMGSNTLLSSTGSGNFALSANVGNSVTTGNNVICIGMLGANLNNSCFIGNIYFNVQSFVGTDPDSVTITSAGRLGRSNVLSRRYKHDIQPMEKASEVLYALKLASFPYNKEYDATQTLAFGLIAEEMAVVIPNLVGRVPKANLNPSATNRSTRCYSTSSLKSIARYRNNNKKSTFLRRS